ncbi:MAG: lamin tail domain-containing protein [Nannocystaceae bacterium]
MTSLRRVTGFEPGHPINASALLEQSPFPRGSGRRRVGLLGLLALLLVGAAGALGACVRDPLPRICPELAAGSLVITEIRGSQAGADTYGQWIEIYNATDEAISLAGLSLRAIKTDGSGDFEFLIRDDDATIGPGAYAVLGGAGAEGKDFVTYEFDAEEQRDLYDAGILELYSCDALIDRVLYRGLPAEGTLSLDGAVPPDADANDDSADPIWCVDATGPQPGEPMTELGIRGTPGETNRPCP